jgi:hypothetical protein
MARGYAHLGQQAGNIMASMMGGGTGIKKQGYNDQMMNNSDIMMNMANASKTSAEAQRIMQSLGMSGDQMALDAGVMPGMMDSYNDFRGSGGQNFGVRGYEPGPDEYFDNADAANLSEGVNTITQAPEGFDEASAIIEQMRTIENMHRLGGGTGSGADMVKGAQGAMDMATERDLMGGRQNPANVLANKAALAGKHKPTGGSTGDDFADSLPAGIRPNFLAELKRNGGDVYAALDYAIARADEPSINALLSSVGQTPMATLGIKTQGDTELAAGSLVDYLNTIKRKWAGSTGAGVPKYTQPDFNYTREGGLVPNGGR